MDEADDRINVLFMYIENEYEKTIVQVEWDKDCYTCDESIFKFPGSYWSGDMNYNWNIYRRHFYDGGVKSFFDDKMFFCLFTDTLLIHEATKIEFSDEFLWLVETENRKYIFCDKLKKKSETNHNIKVCCFCWIEEHDAFMLADKDTTSFE